MDIEKELLEIIAAKRGNKEIALCFWPDDGSWRLDVGNPSANVMLGEVDGEYRSEGATIAAVISDMKRKLGC